MANPFYLATRGFDLAWDAVRIGKSTGVGHILGNIGRDIPAHEAKALFYRSTNIAQTTGSATKGILGFGAKVAAYAGVGATETAKRVGLWSSTVGKVRAAQGREIAGSAWNFMAHTSPGHMIAATGGAAALGYMTSSPDSSASEKLGRMVGFGVGGAYGMKTFSNARNLTHLRGAVRGVALGRYGVAAKSLARGLGLPAEWGIKHSMAAGAMYGLLSDRTSVAEGATFGLTAHLGLRGMGKSWSGARRAELKSIYGTEGIGAAFKSADIFKTGVYLGTMKGAYNQMGTGNVLGLNVMGGAMKGAMVGGALGGGAKLMATHPWMTLGTVGPTLSFAGDAGQAANTVAQAGAPGFDTMNADGDLALALHRTRHG